ncbi:TetR/AcrR family transcriptional regulator [Qingshengfaniella alkalisoli]|uniref:TetR/AcrR family transcriptional regulator n=1 Tax=Qingshengfaniella alkalisoli TaxID=2599296 RepID=A0A5B8IC61_9RHOB|nr:TetR/AcrR family transcriptional regulator [Qingshengfaniella alkalisoli]QDY71126.1 TetR/AcrR family transcriptional regulator [Qingshengfaniella alkalisoli]
MAYPRKADQTRQKILDTGRHLVVAKGFGGVGLSELLKESGVPKGSFYYYFPSKEAFGHAMLRDYVVDYLARMDALIERDLTGADKLIAFCAAWMDDERQAGLVSTCLVVKLAAEVADLSNDLRQVLDEGVNALIARLATILREGLNDGSVMSHGDPDAAARGLYAQWLGAAILSKLSQDQAPLERTLNDTKARLISGAQKGKDQ